MMPKIPTKKVRRIVCRTQLRKVDNEWWVKAYDQNNNRFEGADYFASDREDAELTAREMVNKSLSKPKTKKKE